MMKPLLIKFLFAVLFCCAGIISAAQQAAQLIDSVMKQYSIPGLAVAVIEKENIVYAQSFGVQHLGDAVPLRNDALFRIASISKSFSATAIMQLVEAKKISLDDDVSRLLGFSVLNPAYPQQVITVKMLLSHTSSINDSQGYFTLDVIDPAKNKDAAKCYNSYAPGQDYQYCNLNFNLAGTIIERVSGERFDQYIYRHIIQPLGIVGGFNVNELDSNRFVTLYEFDADSNQLTAAPNAYHPRREQISNYTFGYSTPVFSPAGGMKISATDLAKYMAMHMCFGKYKGTRIISKKSAKAIQSPVSQHYGLAIETTDKLIPGETMKGHTGGAYGLSSMMFFQPKKKFGIVAISSGSKAVYQNGYHPAMQAIVNILYEEIIKANKN